MDAEVYERDTDRWMKMARCEEEKHRERKMKVAGVRGRERDRQTEKGR